MKTSSPGSDRVLIDSVVEALLQGEALLTEINDDSYTRKVPVAFNASIGGHYRHCLSSANVLNVLTRSSCCGRWR